MHDGLNNKLIPKQPTQARLTIAYKIRRNCNEMDQTRKYKKLCSVILFDKTTTVEAVCYGGLEENNCDAKPCQPYRWSAEM